MFAPHVTHSTLAHKRCLIPLVVSTNSARNTVLSKTTLFKRTRLWRVLFVPALLLALSGKLTHANENCKTTIFNEIVSVKSIIDGDTILLKDGRFIRLVGINSPELNSKSPPAEPYAQEAKDALSALLQDVKQIGLMYGRDKHDHYQRLLAHAFLLDGTNIQAELLKQGTAQHILIPPNNAMYECYRQAEQHAQTNNSGLWTHPYFRIMDADELTLRHIGFFRVIGRIKEIKKRNDNYWLVINERFSFRIDGESLKYFKKSRPETLRTHAIQASGWIFPYKSGLNMRIQHPLNMKILD